MGQKKKLANMKKKKNIKKPKKQIVILFAILISIFVINLVSVNALNDFFQFNRIVQNATENVIYVSYSTFDRPSFLGGFFDFGQTADYVSVGRPDELVLYYSSSIADWNNNNPNNQVNNCTLTILKSNLNVFGVTDLLLSTYNYSIFSSPYIVFNQTYNQDTDVNDFYYAPLYDSDYIWAIAICNYNGTNENHTNYKMPFFMHFGSPTFNCKACQESSHSQSISTMDKKVAFDNYNNVLQDYIKKFVLLIFEFVVYAFWLFLIAMFFFVIGMIFWGMYFVYLWLIQFEK